MRSRIWLLVSCLVGACSAGSGGSTGDEGGAAAGGAGTGGASDNVGGESGAAGRTATGGQGGNTGSGNTGSGNTGSGGAGTGGARQGGMSAMGGTGGSRPASGGVGGSVVNPSPGCPAGAVLCDSFENGTDIDPLIWDNKQKGQSKPTAGFYAIDNTVAVDGKRSIRFQFGAEFGVSGGWAFIQNHVPLPAPDDRLYVRYYIMFNPLMLSNGHPYLSTAVDRDSQWEVYPHSMLGFGYIYGDFMLGAWVYQYENQAGSIDWAAVWRDWKTVIKQGQWTCIEEMLQGDHGGPNQEVRIWANGTEVKSLHATSEYWAPVNPPKHWSPKYDGSFWRLGFNSYIGDREQFWLDAFVVSHAPIGCL